MIFRQRKGKKLEGMHSSVELKLRPVKVDEVSRVGMLVEKYFLLLGTAFLAHILRCYLVLPE